MSAKATEREYDVITGTGVANDDNGTKKWYRNGQLHRDDGPAIEAADGTKEWYRNGQLHRDDGPAVEQADGTKKWYRNGQFHRDDGPVIETSDGTKVWCEDGPAVEDADGPKVRYYNGLPDYSDFVKLSVRGDQQTASDKELLSGNSEKDRDGPITTPAKVAGITLGSVFVMAGVLGLPFLLFSKKEDTPSPETSGTADGTTTLRAEGDSCHGAHIVRESANRVHVVFPPGCRFVP